MSTLSDALGFTQNPEGSTEPSVAINANADQAAQLFGASATRNLVADTDYELVEADYLTAVLIVTDDGTVLTGPVSLIYPDAFPTQLIVNNTAQDLTAKKEGQTGVMIPAGESARISCGPDDVLEQTKAPALLGGDLSDALNEAMGANIASAATTDVGAATGNTVTVTGNATITALGTAPAGAGRIVIFSGTPTLTHHATSLILPTGANVIAAAGDVAFFRSLGSGNWKCVAYTKADGSALVSGTAGKHAIWVPAGAMSPSATGGCADLATIASAANQPDIQTLDFDASTAEYAQFALRMPKSWNEGTVTFVPVWSHASTTTNFGVVWSLQGVAVSNDDAIAVSYGTEQNSADTGGTTNDVYIGPESSAITIAGSPAAEDVVFFRLARLPSDGSDTMAIDARLHGVTVYFTTDADTDA